MFYKFSKFLEEERRSFKTKSRTGDSITHSWMNGLCEEGGGGGGEFPVNSSGMLAPPPTKIILIHWMKLWGILRSYKVSKPPPLRQGLWIKKIRYILAGTEPVGRNHRKMLKNPFLGLQQRPLRKWRNA